MVCQPKVFSWQLQYGRNAEPITVLATQAIANIIKSSFGPSGLDKMMVDDIGVSLCVQLGYWMLMNHLWIGCHSNKRWGNHIKFARRSAPSRKDPC